MDLLFFCLIILIMSIQIFVVISNVYLMKLVIRLIQENKQIKHKLYRYERKIELQEWTLLKLLQVLHLPQ